MDEGDITTPTGADPESGNKRRNEMSKYTINHRCGHTTTQQLYGPTRDRERKSEWWATVDCPSCYAAKQAESRNNARHIAEDKINEWTIKGIYVGARMLNPKVNRIAEVIEIDAMHEDYAVIKDVESAETARVPVSGLIDALAQGMIIRA